MTYIDKPLADRIVNHARKLNESGVSVSAPRLCRMFNLKSTKATHFVLYGLLDAAGVQRRRRASQRDPVIDGMEQPLLDLEPTRFVQLPSWATVIRFDVNGHVVEVQQ